ncbi:hypothetical protein [Streptomyces sp. bgisy034]|uniref:hypothetical protein n=1 Tax=Streptomyces sp. bgisy034 TaxID=3413774 RepID=UPI003EBF41C6
MRRQRGRPIREKILSIEGQPSDAADLGNPAAPGAVSRPRQVARRLFREHVSDHRKWLILIAIRIRMTPPISKRTGTT